MGKFYREHFPEGIHKLTENDILQVERTLSASYSDNVLSPIYISMVEKEDESPTFPHPEDWSKM